MALIRPISQGYISKKGLGHFVENCGLENVIVFQSEYTIIEKMSVLPFYMAFCSDSQLEVFWEKYSIMDLYIYLENNIGIRNNSKYLEGDSYFKFCPMCLKEQSEIYLKREHQIQGNLVCWKHGCLLNKVSYSLSWNDIDFVKNIKKNVNIIESEIPVYSQNIAKTISYMVHDIFINGFQDDISTLKSKLLNRLFDLNYLTKDGAFYDFQNFAYSLNANYLYENIRLKEDIIAALSAKITVHINPIIYLFLIIRLFGSLENYYDYIPEERCRKFPEKIHIEQINSKKHEIDYYLSADSKILYEYSILGDTKDEIIAKHLLCNTIYRFSKNYKRFRKCNKCQKKKITEKDIKGTVLYTRYLSTREYGIVHGKKRQQIRNCCSENRISGVIKVGPNFMIPENAPYPKDKRNKKTSLFCDSKQVRYDYWYAFNEYAFANLSYSKIFNKCKPATINLKRLSIGFNSCYIMFSLHKKSKKVLTELYIKDDKELFKKLFVNKDIIESEIGSSLEWRELPNRKASRIIVSKDYDYTDRTTWNVQFDWLIDMSLRFREVFAKYI